MTKNITMAIDADLLKKARKIAIDKNSTLSELVRNYLYRLVEQEDINKEEVVSELSKLFDHSNARIGEKNWMRDDLYER